MTRALKVTRLDVGREIAPGVPWCFADSAGTCIAITLKSGNFGAEDFFAATLDKPTGPEGLAGSGPRPAGPDRQAAAQTG